MKYDHKATSSIVIDVSPAEVWKALTDPEIVKKYLFWTTVISDWKEGSPITYTGTWEWKVYEDKGTILKVEPEKLLSMTYWSSFSELEDEPENYQTVTYDLTKKSGGTELKITQDNIVSEEVAIHSKKNWETVLKKLKDILEGA